MKAASSTSSKNVVYRVPLRPSSYRDYPVSPLLPLSAPGLKRMSTGQLYERVGSVMRIYNPPPLPRRRLPSGLEYEVHGDVLRIIMPAASPWAGRFAAVGLALLPLRSIPVPWTPRIERRPVRRPAAQRRPSRLSMAQVADVRVDLGSFDKLTSDQEEILVASVARWIHADMKAHRNARGAR